MPDRKPLPKKVEEWKAPWEVHPETGEDVPEDEQEIDRDRLKKYLFGLLTDKARLQTTNSETAAKIEELERAVAEAPDAAALATLQTQLADARRQAAEAAKGPGAQALKFEIALEKGLTKAQARRLVGETREELEADADELLADLGVRQQQSGKEDPPDEGGEPDGRSQPRNRFANPQDPKPNAGKDKLPSPEEVMKLYQATR